jgi:hypothetical protein
MPDRAVAVVSPLAITRRFTCGGSFWNNVLLFSFSDIIFARKSVRDELLSSRLNNL